MNRNELAKDLAKGAAATWEIIEEAVGDRDVDAIVTRTLGMIIEAAVLETCRRIAEEHIYTEPSRN